MKFKYIFICLFFSILFISIGFYVLPFAFLGVFLFVLGIILIVMQTDKVLNSQ